MLLNTVLIVSREVFEAAMLISLLLTICYLNKNSLLWIWLGVAAGFGGALLWAFNLIELTTWWDFRGQELSVAAIYFALFTGLLILCIVRLRLPFGHTSARTPQTFPKRSINILLATLIALALVREVGEIIVFFFSHNADLAKWKSLLLGLLMGLAIGSSLATVLYFVLVRISPPLSWNLVRYWLAWIAGVTLMKSATQLIQIGFLPQGSPLWDSSGWLTEQGILGHICSALFGYKAQPSPVQLFALLLGFGLCVIPLSRSHFRQNQIKHRPQSEKVS